MYPRHVREAAHGRKDRPRLDHEVRHDEGLSAPGVLRRRQWRPGEHRHDGREPRRGRGTPDLRHERRLLLHRVEHGLLHRHDDHEQPHGLPRLQQRQPCDALLLHGDRRPPVRARQARAHGRQDVRVRRPRLRPRDGRRTQDPQRRAHELVQLPREGGADQSRQRELRHRGQGRGHHRQLPEPHAVPARDDRLRHERGGRRAARDRRDVRERRASGRLVVRRGRRGRRADDDRRGMLGGPASSCSPPRTPPPP